MKLLPVHMTIDLPSGNQSTAETDVPARDRERYLRQLRTENVIVSEEERPDATVLTMTNGPLPGHTVIRVGKNGAP